MSEKKITHIPVFLNEIKKTFGKQKLKNFFDGTLGLGGHAFALLEEHPEMEQYFASDRDLEAKKIAFKKLEAYQEKLEFVNLSYSEAIENFLQEKGPSILDGALLDLGVSSLQLDDPERGFSFQTQGPLDMRMNQTAGFSAKDVVNKYSEKELNRIFWEYGEEPKARQIAKAIVQARQSQCIETIPQFLEAIASALPPRGKKHPATKVFQAIRIEVNDELGEIYKSLENLVELLSPGAYLAVITFHSLEDRIVKNIFKKLAGKSYTNNFGLMQSPEKKKVKLISSKPILPSDEEIRANPRSRSAKLRIIAKLL